MRRVLAFIFSLAKNGHLNNPGRMGRQSISAQFKRLQIVIHIFLGIFLHVSGNIFRCVSTSHLGRQAHQP